jgi:hypothetical protein
MESPPTSIFMKLKRPFTMFFSPWYPTSSENYPLGIMRK